MPDTRLHAPYGAEPQRARLRVLPITGDEEGRFLVVFDRVPLGRVAAYSSTAEDMKARTGAAGVLVVPDDIDVPQAVTEREV